MRKGLICYIEIPADTSVVEEGTPVDVTLF